MSKQARAKLVSAWKAGLTSATFAKKLCGASADKIVPEDYLHLRVKVTFIDSFIRSIWPALEAAGL